MLLKPKRKEDRRKVNRAVKVDKRGTKVERRRCPECRGPLMTKISRAKGGTKTLTVCLKCGWSAISAQVYSHLLPD